MRKLFIYLGNKYHKFETKLNREFCSFRTQSFRQATSDEQAIEREWSSSMKLFLYHHPGLPIMELVRAS